MKAILMAAGIGSRLSRSVQKPKSVLDIGDTTIIRHSVEMFLENGIETSVVVGYKKEEIFSALEGLPVTYFYNPFFKVTNSMASLWFAKDFIDSKQDLLLGNADVYWEEPVLKSIIANPEDIVMLGDRSRTQEGDYFFYTIDNKVAKYGKELPVNQRSCEYVGIAKLKNRFLNGFKERMEELVRQEVYDLWWENVLYEFCNDYPIYVQDIEGAFWGEVDYIEDYNRILKYLKLQPKSVIL